MADEKDREQGFLEQSTPSKFEETATESSSPIAAIKPSRAHYEGHRERLRQRFRENGGDALADYELLELLLFRTIPRADTKPLAKALLVRFGSFAEVLGAQERLLMEVPGCGRSIAADLKFIAAAAQRMGRSTIKGREVLGSWSKVIEYCTAAMAYEEREQFRILFLDKKNGVIADEVQQVGTVDHTPVYPREIVRRALELSASAIILVHNHPTTPVSITLDHAGYR